MQFVPEYKVLGCKQLEECLIQNPQRFSYFQYYKYLY